MCFHVSNQTKYCGGMVESQVRGVASMTVNVNVKGALRQICKTTIGVSSNLSHLSNVTSPELQGHQIPMAKVSFGTLAMNACYTVLLGHCSVLGSGSESGLALVWVIAADLKRQKRSELEECQTPRAGQGALRRGLPCRSPCSLPAKKFRWRNRKTLFPITQLSSAWSFCVIALMKLLPVTYFPQV